MMVKRNLTFTEAKQRAKLLHEAGYKKLPGEKTYQKIWTEKIKDDFVLQLEYGLYSTEVMWPFINLEELLKMADERAKAKLKETKANYLNKGESNL